MEKRSSISNKIAYLKRGDGPRLVFISGAVRGREFSIKHLALNEKAMLGCHQEADLWFSGATVRDRHAVLENVGKQEWTISTGDRNALVKVNREPVSTAVIVHGDIIELGRHKLVFLTNSSPARKPSGAKDLVNRSLSRIFSSRSQ